MDNPPPRSVWPFVVVTLAIIAAVVTLQLAGKDTGVILTAIAAATPVFAGALYQRLDQVRAQTNGTQTRLMDKVDQLQRQLANLAAAIPADMLPAAREILRDSPDATSPVAGRDSTSDGP